MGFLIVIGAGVIAGGVVHEVFRSIPVWAPMIALVGVGGWIYSRIVDETQDAQIPITVQDLVEAASSSKWVKKYDSDVGSLLQRLS